PEATPAAARLTEDGLLACARAGSGHRQDDVRDDFLALGEIARHQLAELAVADARHDTDVGERAGVLVPDPHGPGLRLHLDGREELVNLPIGLDGRTRLRSAVGQRDGLQCGSRASTALATAAGTRHRRDRRATLRRGRTERSTAAATRTPWAGLGRTGVGDGGDRRLKTRSRARLGCRGRRRTRRLCRVRAHRRATATADARRLRGRLETERREHLGRRPEAERRVRDAEHVLGRVDDDPEVRRQARPEAVVRVRDDDPDRIGNDVALDRRVEVDVLDRAVERRVRVRIDLELDLHARADLADVGLVDAGRQAQRVEVGGDLEERRDVHARLNRLADVDEPVDDHTVDGRLDLGVRDIQLGLREVGARLHQLLFGRGNLRLARLDGQLGLFELRLVGEPLLEELLRAREVPLGIFELHALHLDVGLLALDVGRLDIDLRLQEGRIQAGDDLAPADDRVEVRVELDDRARHLRPDLDRAQGLERSRRLYRLDDRAARDDGTDDLRRLFSLPVDEEVPGAASCDRQQPKCRYESFHDRVCRAL